MAYDAQDIAVLLEDFGGTVRAPNGEDALGILKEGDEIPSDGLGSIQEGEALLVVATAEIPRLALERQAIVEYRDDENDEWRKFRVRIWSKVGGGSLSHLIGAWETN